MSLPAATEAPNAFECMKKRDRFRADAQRPITAELEYSGQICEPIGRIGPGWGKAPCPTEQATSSFVGTVYADTARRQEQPQGMPDYRDHHRDFHPRLSIGRA